MSDFFRVKKITDLNKVDENTVFPTSDFASITGDNKFVQLEYVEGEDKKLEPYKVYPGIWAIRKTMAGLDLYKTSFAADQILETFTQTKDITDKIDCFFRRIDVYKKRFPEETPMRRILLYGPPGTGKTSSLVASVRKYAAEGKTHILVWHTDKFEAYQVKDFVKSFEYIGVDRVILIVEDVGGVEQENSRPSESSLLSLLDNKELTFTLPTMIIATTNYPGIFKGNLTNRPGRFADKIKVGFPKPEARKELLKFFAQGQDLSQDLIDLVTSNNCKEFTADHLKEIFVRSDLYEKSFLEVTKQLIEETKDYNKNFQDGNGRMGLFND